MRLLRHSACGTLLLMTFLLGFAQGAGAQQRALPLTLDEEYAALAAQVPGFGGMFEDPATGHLVVYLQDPGKSEIARLAVRDFLARVDPARTAIFPRTDGRPRQVTFRKGDYDFRDLARWRRLVDEQEGDVLTMSDIDEARNRVLVGVIDEKAGERIGGRLKDLGVPAAAVTVRVIPPVVTENLQGFARPVRGGLQIESGGGICSLGFVALREYPSQIYDFNGSRYVMTNSHCTSSFGVVLGDSIGQPTLANPIGVEISDPPFNNNASDSACPSASNICRRSDAALFVLDDNSSATSTFNGVATASGLTLTGTTFYAGKQQGFAPNQRVAKIGRTTGQTSGTVTNTCVNVSISGRVMVCQMYATYASSGGDSGSPVWYTDLNGNRWIMGIHWGRDNLQDRAIFSLWLDAYSEIANDVLARTGQQWMPALTTGPANFTTN
jgi:hypothetical protein